MEYIDAKLKSFKKGIIEKIKTLPQGRVVFFSAWIHFIKDRALIKQFVTLVSYLYFEILFSVPCYHKSLLASRFDILHMHIYGDHDSST